MILKRVVGENINSSVKLGIEEHTAGTNMVARGHLLRLPPPKTRM